MAVGDFTGDGRGDLITGQIGTEQDPRETRVFRGRGSGRLSRGRDIRLDGVGGVGLADFDRDGGLDVVRASTAAIGSAPTIALGLGDGRGGFLRRRYFGGLDYAPGDLAVADFNRDAIPDLAVGEGCCTYDTTAGHVWVLLGDSLGGFSAPTQFPVGRNDATHVAAADVNRDRAQDLVVLTLPMSPTAVSEVGVLLGDGQGGFAAPSSYPVGAPSGSLAVGRLNGDRHPDIAATTAAGVRVLFGNRGGAFGPAQTHRLRGRPHSVSLADYDGDGARDLAVTTARQGVRVLLGDGRGSFPRRRRFALPGCKSACPAALLTIGRLNEDRRPDLVAACDYTCGFTRSGAFRSGVWVLLNRSRSTPSRTP